MSPSVQIDKKQGVITKPVPRDRIMGEVRMTRCAFELAEESGLFRVPKVVDYDLTDEWLKLEYIPDTLPMHRLLRSPRVPMEMFDRVGRVVAQIHCHIKLEEEHTFPLPPEIDRGGPQSFLHGDLNMFNMQYDATTDQVVVFDWSSSPLIGDMANWGTVYWDLAHFTRSLITSPPIRLTGKRARWALADRFLQSYVNHSGQAALDRPFFDYCRYIHRFFTSRDKVRLEWYRYLRYAVFNLNSFRRYVDKKIVDGAVFGSAP